MRNQPQNVIVHNDREDQQQEHHADGDEALLHAQAQVTPDRSFDEEHQDVAAIERRNRQEIQHGQVHADHGHQGEQFRHTFSCGFAGGSWQFPGAFELLERHVAAEKFGDNVNNLPGHQQVCAGGIDNCGAQRQTALHQITTLNTDANLPVRNAVPDADLLRAYVNLKRAIAALDFADSWDLPGIAAPGLGNSTGLIKSFPFTLRIYIAAF